MITGPEPLLVLEAADAVRARAREEGCAEREVFDADGRDFDWDPLQATFHAPSLFSARRLIELRMPTARPGKAGAEVITDFCAQPPADVVLLVTGGEWCKKHGGKWRRSEEHTSETQSIMRNSYAVLCLKKKKKHRRTNTVSGPYRYIYQNCSAQNRPQDNKNYVR